MWSLCIISSVLGKGTDGEGKLINCGSVFGLNAVSFLERASGRLQCHPGVKYDCTAWSHP